MHHTSLLPACTSCDSGQTGKNPAFCTMRRFFEWVFFHSDRQKNTCDLKHNFYFEGFILKFGFRFFLSFYIWSMNSYHEPWYHDIDWFSTTHEYNMNLSGIRSAGFVMAHPPHILSQCISIAAINQYHPADLALRPTKVFMFSRRWKILRSHGLPQSYSEKICDRQSMQNCNTHFNCLRLVNGKLTMWNSTFLHMNEIVIKYFSPNLADLMAFIKFHSNDLLKLSQINGIEICIFSVNLLCKMIA